MIPKDLILETARVRLAPLSADHAEDLQRAGDDPEIFRYTRRVEDLSTIESTLEYIKRAQDGESSNTDVPFAIIDRPSGRAIGATRFFDIDARAKKVSLGWTWISRPFWRTHVNTECKYLMLCHAFDVARMRRVQIAVDSENLRSQAAVRRIGGIYEGTLRNSAFRDSDQTCRHHMLFSIIDSEWKDVKLRLRSMLGDRL